MHHASHWLAGDFGVAVREGDGYLLMHARDKLKRRRRRHAVVDDRFVQPFERIAGNRGDVFDPEATHDIDHEVAAAAALRRAVGARSSLLRFS
jgi:hypothetical protein